MGRNTGKGKAVAGASGSNKNKRRAVEEAPERGPKPNWKAGPLSNQPVEWQADLFHEQMNKLASRKEAFICEKEVKGELFSLFKIIEKFEALGWEATLRCYDGETKTLYDAQIQEWVATLRCPPFTQPENMKLIGTVDGVDIEMSFETLRRVAKFDSKQANQYMFPSMDDLYFNPDNHPRWNHMLDTLFLPGTTHGTLLRKNLRMEAKLLLIICCQNIIPWRGDKLEVRFPEVPILYMLMNGAPLVHFRWLVMNNIWISRNSVDRKIIPHCRLITALLKKYGVITGEDKGSYKRLKPFDLTNLGAGWEYKETDRDHRLKSDGQRWRVVKPDAPPLPPGQDEELNSGEDAPSGEEDYDMDMNPHAGRAESNIGGGMNSGGDGYGQGETPWSYLGSIFDYAQTQYDQN